MAYGAYIKSFGSGIGRYKGGNYKTRAEVEKQSRDFFKREEEAEKVRDKWNNMGKLSTKSWK